MSPRISIPLGPGRLFDGSPPPVLDPAGPYAGSITLLSWVLFASAALVLAVVEPARGSAGPWWSGPAESSFPSWC